MEHGFLFSTLNMSAWRMDAPEMFGSFHIAAAAITIAAAVIAAAFFSRRVPRSIRRCSSASDSPLSSESSAPAGNQRSAYQTGADSALIRTLAVCGWILAALELYKQLFLYYIVNNGAYDWWYFPFQLCSVPMYLCILLPFVRGRLRSAFLTFMSGYTFISALAALAFPEDFLRSYVILTVHGFIWHGMLLFISLLIFPASAACCPAVPSGSSHGSSQPVRSANSHQHDADAFAEAAAPCGTYFFKRLLDSAALFALLCVIALAVNIAVEPVMAYGTLPHSYAAMFYLNPYHLSSQPIVSDVQMAAGIPAGLILYALAIAAAASLTCLVFSVLNRRRSSH